jgi:hypothetical protein
MSLRTRIALIVTAIVAITVAVGGLSVLYTTSRELRSQVDAFLIVRTDRFGRGPTLPPGAQGTAPLGAIGTVGPGFGPGTGAPGPPGPNGTGGPLALGDLADPDTVVQVLDTNGRVTGSISGQPSLPISASDRALARDHGDRELRDATVVSELVELATDVRTEEPVEPVDLTELAGTVASRFARRTGREVTVCSDGPQVVDGRRTMLDRAVSNLVDNALKFSADPVEVAVDGTSVEVRDRGVGVRPEDRAKVFDRFYRAPDARTRPGAGLGLSIVRQIAEVHGGQVALLPRDGGGTIARLSLPSP